MKATVIICTHNGATRIRRTLDGLAGQTLGREQFEVLVIDNGSTDDTKGVCGSHTLAEGETPALRIVSEPRVGLSVARNTAVREARAEIVAFLDDDAVPESEWLEVLVRTFDDPDVGAAGGKVALEFETEPPWWLTEYMLPYLTLIDWGTDVRDVDGTSAWIAGANAAFRSASLPDVPFRTDLGRIGGFLLSGEETDLCRRLQADGWTTRYVPDAVVHHWVSGSRLTRAFFRRRAFASGLSASRSLEAGVRFRRSWRAVRSLAAGVVRWVSGWRCRNRFEAEMLTLEAMGTLLSPLVRGGRGEQGKGT